MEGRIRRARASPPWAWRQAVNSVLWTLRHVFAWRVWARTPEVEVPPGRPLVVVFNHTSMVDAFLVVDAVWRLLGRWCQPLVKAELFDVVVIGTVARRAGAIPVARDAGDGREAAYDDAVAKLRAGGSILIAPEGTTTHDGSLLPLRHGAARLALEAGVDILVVTHFGAQRAFSPVVRFPDRNVPVTMMMDVVTPFPDEDAGALTGRIAATMIDRSETLRDDYPQADRRARWWPPYETPASPTATARENLERYRHSMADAVEHARERMAQMAEDHDIEERVTHLRERGQAAAEDLAARSRVRVESFADQTRVRAESFADQTRELMDDLADQTRTRMDELTDQTRERMDELMDQARERMEELTDQARERVTSLTGHHPHGEADHHSSAPDEHSCEPDRDPEARSETANHDASSE